MSVRVRLFTGTSNKIPSKAGSPLSAGSILGHESMGIVDKVGPDVKNLKVGDRVVISAPISCGSCGYCKRGQFSLCETTNPSEMTELMVRPSPGRNVSVSSLP